MSGLQTLEQFTALPIQLRYRQKKITDQIKLKLFKGPAGSAQATKLVFKFLTIQRPP